MKRIIIGVAVLAATLSLTAVAFGAANVKSSSFSVNNQGQLVCAFDVSGLGNVSSTPGTCSATSTADYQCINNGGRNPSAGNKSTSTEPVSTGPLAIPVHNGRASDSILVNPAGAGGFTCPPGQTLYLVGACYSDITLTIGGATITNPGPVCNSSPLRVKQ